MLKISEVSAEKRQKLAVKSIKIKKTLAISK
jgi:hypothetical protein